MFSEFHFDDIVFGIFPKVGGVVEEAYDCWTKNSVADIIDMLMQALEVGLTFCTDCTHLLLMQLKVLHSFTN